MAFCMHCGNRISDLAIECPKCGTLTPVAQTQQAAPSLSPGLQRSFPNAPVLRPLSVGEIIDAAIKIYRSNAGSLLKAVAIVVVPVQVLGALIQTSVVPDEINPVEQTPFDPSQVDPSTFDPSVISPSPFDASDLWTLVGGILLSALLNWLAAQLATAASLRAVSEAYLGERSDWRQSLEFAFKRFRPLVWLSLISAFGVGIGYILCFIPGIWLSISWSIAIPALLFEDLRGTKALGRSFDLVKGRWWSVAGAVVLGQIIASVLGFVFGFAFGALSFLGDSAFVTFISSAMSTAISQTLVTPFLAAMIAIIYFDQRVRKEGFDLELLAHQVGGGDGLVPQPGIGGPAPAPSPAPGAAPVAPPGQPAVGAQPAAPAARPRPQPRARPSRPLAAPGADPDTAFTRPPPDEASAPEESSYQRPAPRRRPTRPGFDAPPPPEDADTDTSDPDR